MRRRKLRSRSSLPPSPLPRPWLRLAEISLFSTLQNGFLLPPSRHRGSNPNCCQPRRRHFLHWCPQTLLTLGKQSQSALWTTQQYCEHPLSKFSADQKLEATFSEPFSSIIWTRVYKEKHKKDLKGRRKREVYTPRGGCSRHGFMCLPHELLRTTHWGASV